MEKTVIESFKVLELNAVAYKDVCVQSMDLTQWPDSQLVMDKPPHFHYDVDYEFVEYLLADVDHLDMEFDKQMKLEAEKK